MDNYNIEKVIGQGMDGIILLVNKNMKKYAMKLSFSNNLSNAVKKLKLEKHFLTIMSKECGFCITQLHEFGIVNEDIKKILQNYDVSNNLIKKFSNNTIYTKRIYDLVDGTLYDVFYDLNKNQIYSCIIQIANYVNIMEKNFFVHNDLHNLKNIGYRKTNEDKINIGDSEIPTFGYKWTIIDYDRIFKYDDNNKFMKKENLEKFKNELLYLLLLGFGYIANRSTLHYDQYNVSITNMILEKMSSKKKEDIEFFNSTKKLRKIKKINQKYSNLPNKIKGLLFVYYYPNKMGKFLASDNGDFYWKFKKYYVKRNNKIFIIPFRIMKNIIKYKNKIVDLIPYLLKQIKN
jgi:hypothetical protein